jgi:hypothetical protein
MQFAVVTAAVVLSLIANLRCSMVTLKAYDNSSFWSLFSAVPRTVGLWCFATMDGTTYSLRDASADSDRNYMAARGAGTLAFIMGSSIWLFIVASNFRSFGGGAYFFIGVLCMLTLFVQGLAFLMFKSDMCIEVYGYGGCELGRGGICAAISMVCWLLASIMFCLWRDGERDFSCYFQAK